MISVRRARLAPSAFVAIALLCAALQAADGQPQAVAAARPAAASCQRSGFRVVIDVGHTVEVPGAMSARGVAEYTFNLALAQQAQQALIEAGFANAVLLTVDKPPPRGLIERATRANAMAADLFIAIHHDSVPDNLLQNWDYQGTPNRYNDDYPGYAIFISNDNADRAGSLAFGRLLGLALQARGLHYTAHYTLPLMGHRRRELLDAESGVYRYDQLIVLRLTRMPAVLLEAGSIVNRDEELALGTPERRAVTSTAIAAAVADFCQARARPAGGSVVRRVAPPPAVPAAR